MKLSPRSSAFTLIELIMAVGVVAVITAVAIPSFSTSNGGNQWNEDMAKLSACITGAQQAASAPVSTGQSTTARFTAANLSFAAATKTLTCQIYSYSDKGGRPPYLSGAGGLLASGSGGTAVGTSVKVSGVSAAAFSVAVPIVAFTNYYLYFGVADAGRPVGYNYNGASSGSLTAVSQLSIILTKAADGSKTTYIMPGLGTPLTSSTN